MIDAHVCGGCWSDGEVVRHQAQVWVELVERIAVQLRHPLAEVLVSHQQALVAQLAQYGCREGELGSSCGMACATPQVQLPSRTLGPRMPAGMHAYICARTYACIFMPGNLSRGERVSLEATTLCASLYVRSCIICRAGRGRR